MNVYVPPLERIWGITGSQGGLTHEQRDFFWKLFIGDGDSRYDLDEFHHGGCIGVDEEVRNLVDRANKIRVDNLCDPISIICHRGSTPSKWAITIPGEVVLPEKDNIIRNHDIVDVVGRMYAAPGEMNEVLRSGTWATIRYARDKVKKHLFIVYPDGYVGEYHAPR